MYNPQNFVNSFDRIAKSNGTSITQVLLSCGLSKDLVSNVKHEHQKGLPSADKLILIAQELNVTLEYLLGLTDYPGPIADYQAFIEKHCQTRVDTVKTLNGIVQLIDSGCDIDEIRVHAERMSSQVDSINQAVAMSFKIPIEGLTGLIEAQKSDLNENEREFLEILHRFSEREQILLIDKTEEIADELEDKINKRYAKKGASA